MFRRAEMGTVSEGRRLKGMNSNTPRPIIDAPCANQGLSANVKVLFRLIGIGKVSAVLSMVIVALSQVCSCAWNKCGRLQCRRASRVLLLPSGK